MDARAVLRLLVRSDNNEAVLFMDKIYYSSNHDPSLEQQARGGRGEVRGSLRLSHSHRLSPPR